MFKIGDKIIIMSINEAEGEENLKYYSTIDGIQVKEDGLRYTVWGKAINPDITALCTDDEIKEFYN